MILMNRLKLNLCVAASFGAACAFAQDGLEQWTDDPDVDFDVAEVTEVEYSPGYFPTLEESGLLSGEFGADGPDYPRSHVPAGSVYGAPDTIVQGATGIWPYEIEDEDFYSRNPQVFQPIDNVFGVLIPREALIFQGGPQTNTSLAIDPGVPLTRRLERDRAHFRLFKAGPLFADILSVSGTALYSDVNSTRPYPHDDGFIAAIDLTARAYLRITDNTYISLSGTVYYLPTEGDVGFYLHGNDSTFARINTEYELGAWDFQFFDEFRVLHRISDMLDPIEHDEIATSGRYRLGRVDDARVGDAYFSGDYITYRNNIGFRATTPMGDDWRFWGGYDRFDYWLSGDADDRRNLDRVRLQIIHEGDWRIAPYITYNLQTPDEYASIHQSVMVGATTMLTPNVRLGANGGYYWQTGQGLDEKEGGLWGLELRHTITANTTHSLNMGNNFTNNDFGDDFIASYLRYALTHRFSHRLSGSGWVQWSDLERTSATVGDGTVFLAGAGLTYALGDYTQARFRFAYQDVDYRETSDLERWIYRLELSRRLATRLTGTLTYQYEDVSQQTGVGDLDEHLIMFNLTRYF